MNKNKTKDRISLKSKLESFFLKLRERRTERVAKNLSRSAHLSTTGIEAFWQPRWLVVLKIILFVIVAVKIYSFHPVVGGWLEKVFAFFKLNEIYNFDFPQPEFFVKIAKYLFAALIGYYSLFFLYRQALAFFSVLVISPREHTAHFIKSWIIQKETFVLPMPEVGLAVHKQNILGRLFRIGGIELHKHSGETVLIPGLSRSASAMQTLTRMIAPHES